MNRNVAGQTVGAQMVSATDGSAFTGAVTVSVTGDAGTQATGSVGAGACTHEGNGYHSYLPAQAETDYAHVAFTFTGTGAVPVTVQIYTSPTVAELVDTLMQRASSNWEAGAAVKSLGTAVMKATHRVEPSAGSPSVLQIYRSNGTTVHAEQVLTTNAAIDPIEAQDGALAP